MTTPTDAELTARLAEISGYRFPVYLDSGDGNVIKQAADRLTALSAENNRLRAALKHLGGRDDRTNHQPWYARYAREALKEPNDAN